MGAFKDKCLFHTTDLRQIILRLENIINRKTLVNANKFLGLFLGVYSFRSEKGKI